MARRKRGRPPIRVLGFDATPRRLNQAAALYFLVSVTTLHFVVSSLDPMQRPISAYLKTPWRLLTTTSFLALSLALASVVPHLRSWCEPSVSRTVGTDWTSQVNGVFFIGAMRRSTSGMVGCRQMPIRCEAPERARANVRSRQEPGGAVHRATAAGMVTDVARYIRA
jgi:hypothetical protein